MLACIKYKPFHRFHEFDVVFLPVLLYSIEIVRLHLHFLCGKRMRCLKWDNHNWHKKKKKNNLKINNSNSDVYNIIYPPIFNFRMNNNNN